MELKDFIKGVLADITDAIQDIQGNTSQPAIISPMNLGNGDYIVTNKGKVMVNKVDFEVVVSAESRESVNGEIKGVVSVISAAIGSKVGASSTGKDENITKIRFSIPVVYPSAFVEQKKITGF